VATRSTRAAGAAPRTFPEVDDLNENQRARRQRIVDAGGRLMMALDYDRIQVKDVADEAGVALGTLYRYFNSKDHVFACALQTWSQGFGERLELPAAGSPAARVKAVYQRAVKAFARQPRVYGAMLQVQSSTDPHAAAVFRAFARQQSDAFGLALEGSRLSAAKRRDVIAVMNAVLDENLRAWCLGLQPVTDVRTAIDRAADLILSRR
jgi:AcrR family transcriptional regulator